MSELPPDAVPEPVPPPEPIPPEPIELQPARPSFRAGKAFAAFALLIGAQFLAGMGVILIAMIVAVAGGANFGDPQLVTRVMRQWDVPVIAASAFISAISVLVAARIWAWDLVRDRSDAGLGVRSVPKRTWLIAAAAGVGIAAFYFGLIQLVPFDPNTPLGPLAQVASGGPLARIVFAIVALLYAPLFEEFLFRGLLFKGFSASWGVKAAGVVVTVLFVLLHLFETINYWPATLAVTTMAIGTLLARIRTGSLVPSVAMHFAYNAAVVAGAYAT